jgi:DNA-binding protein H-NS
MNKMSYAALQAKLQKDIEKLQKQAKALQSKRRRPVLAGIIRSMKEYDISPEEITAAFGKTSSKPKSSTPIKPTKSVGTKKPVPIKYRHPESGATWTGRGKAPLWVVEAESAGKNRKEFLI